MHPKKYKTGNHTFGSCGNFGLNCVRTISLAEIRTQNNSRRFFRPKKYTVKSSTQKNTSEPPPPPPTPCHFYTRVSPLGALVSPSYRQTQALDSAREFWSGVSKYSSELTRSPFYSWMCRKSSPSHFSFASTTRGITEYIRLQVRPKLTISSG